MSKNIIDEIKAIEVQSFNPSEIDELFEQAVKEICQYEMASASLLQRRLQIGYARAARLIDQLEWAGVISSPEGSKPRIVLIKSVEDIKNLKKKIPHQEPEPEVEVKYKKASASVIKKPIKNPWKKSLFEIVNDKNYKKEDVLTFPIGYQKEKLITKSLENFTHLSITGNIISNKEVMMDTILVSLIMKASPKELKLIIVDSTKYSSVYERIPHLLAPVITDSEKSISALRWSMYEMNRRQKLFDLNNVRNIEEYIRITKSELPRILIVLNHFEDMVLYSYDETVDAVARLTSLAHKTGIHLMLVNNRYSKLEIPQVIQSNIPNKVFFRLTSSTDMGSNKIKEVEKLQPGEAMTIFDYENDFSKIDAVYTSSENIHEAIKAI